MQHHTLVSQHQQPHIRHHGHQQPPVMHPLPPRGVNMGPPQQPLPPHHRSNGPKHPGPPYIPSQHIDHHRLNYQPPRINQLHQTPMPPPQIKGRPPLLSNNNNHGSGGPMTLKSHQKPLKNINNNSVKSNNNIICQKKSSPHLNLQSQKSLQQRLASHTQQNLQIIKKSPLSPTHHPPQISSHQPLANSTIITDKTLPPPSLHSHISSENIIQQSTNLSQPTNTVQSTPPPSTVSQSSTTSSLVYNQQPTLHDSTNATNQINTISLNNAVDPSKIKTRLQLTKNIARKNKDRQLEDSNGNKFTALNTILENTPSECSNANTKDKTPMCLVNELARYNKIQHQYRLTGEQGPAHCKHFTVTLKLGDEEYTSEGQSIKKAQHAAAADAVSKTKYDHPPPKTIRLKSFGRMGMGNITPTVALNALAMKLGQTAIYVFDPPTISVPTGGVTANIITNQQKPIISNGHTSNSLPLNTNHNQQHQQPNFFVQNTLNNYNNHYSRNGNFSNGARFTTPSRKPTFNRFGPRIFPFNAMGPSGNRELCKITLIVGKQRFVGIGPTIQAAKHDAATRALEVIKPLSPECNDANSSDNESDLKSPISQVHEMALKRNLSVTFDVQSELGPPHLKTFITICKVGNIITEGDGNGKKLSKKRAAEKMLDELKKLPPLSPSKSIPISKSVQLKKIGRSKEPIAKKRTKNLIKENPEPEVVEDVNPISKLIQIMQGLKEREPIYTVVEEKGVPRRREFVIEVSAGGQTARGSGSNKKMAKRNAAQNLLIQMGYETESSPNKENNPQQLNKQEKGASHEKISRLEYNKDDVTIKINQESADKVNGSPIMQQNLKIGCQIIQDNAPTKMNDETNDPPSIELVEHVSSNLNNTISDHQEIDNEETEINSNSNSSNSCLTQNLGTTYSTLHKDKLMYLAQILGFSVEFSDYPKGNHGEYLTIVTLSTEPPQICHGAGPDTATSQDKAAMEALQMITKMGLDNIKPKQTTNQFTNGKNCALEANKI